MKEEDADWQIYHLIAQIKTATAEDLVKKSGLEISAVESSLCRLEQKFLVNRNDVSFRVMSVGESLMCSQVKYSDDLPFVIENGLIKEKKTDHARE